jgi:tRNA-2-methylthio-N6-dimethylallyladenosine synthase
MVAGRSAFVQLLEAVDQVGGLDRVRFTSPHPKGYGDDLVAAYGRLGKLCPSAHLPVQSGSDRVLKLMHRGYTRSHFVGLVEKLRRVRPEMGVTTDLIVGFPGETESDFGQTLDLVREVEFDQAYVFKYSPRKETPAAQMPDQVPQEVREARNHQLLSVVNEVGRRRYEREVGQRVEVLVEGLSRKNAARFEGRTGTNKLVVFEGNDRHLGQVLEMRVVRTGNFTLYGDPAILNLNAEAEGGRAGET